MKQKQPLVSVVMPVYNVGEFLDTAITSILNQTYRNLELIIVNDASMDNSGRIIAKYRRLDKRVHVVTLKKNVNQGGDAAGNIGYKLAKGKYVARMDGDDVAELNRIEKQVTYMEKHTRVAVLGTQAKVIDREGKVAGVKNVPTSHETILREFFTFHPIIHPTVMVRKSAIKRKDLYKTDYDANNDYLTFFGLITSGATFANLDEPLLQYRIHGENDSLAHVKRNFVNSLKIRYRAINEMGYKPTLLSIIKLIVQSVLVFALPERATIELYYRIRGIKSWINLPYPGDTSFARLKAYVQTGVASIVAFVR